MKRLRIIGGCFRWAARVGGGLTVLMFLVFFIGEGVTAPSHLPADEIIMFIGLAAALASLLAAWRWTLAGCLLALAGYAVFFIANKRLEPANLFSLFPVVVALYAIAWVFDRFHARRMECSIANES